jgi:hypothetical protein
MEKNSLSDFITGMLPVVGFMSLFSSFIWTIIGDNQDKWFSRFVI